jgi:hypothetical protein
MRDFSAKHLRRTTRLRQAQKVRLLKNAPGNLRPVALALAAKLPLSSVTWIIYKGFA